MAIGLTLLVAMAAAALILPLLDSAGARLDPGQTLEPEPVASPAASTTPTTAATAAIDTTAPSTTTPAATEPVNTAPPPPRRSTPTTAVVRLDDPGMVAGLDRTLVGVNDGAFGYSFWIEGGVIRHIGDARDFWECFALTGGTRHVISLDVLERSGLPFDWASDTDRCTPGALPNLPDGATHPNPYEQSVIMLVDGPVATAMWVEDGSLQAVADDGDFWDCYILGVGAVHVLRVERLTELGWPIDRTPADRCATPTP